MISIMQVNAGLIQASGIEGGLQISFKMLSIFFNNSSSSKVHHLQLILRRKMRERKILQNSTVAHQLSVEEGQEDGHIAAPIPVASGVVKVSLDLLILKFGAILVAVVVDLEDLLDLDAIQQAHLQLVEQMDAVLVKILNSKR